MFNKQIVKKKKTLKYAIFFQLDAENVLKQVNLSDYDDMIIIKIL